MKMMNGCKTIRETGARCAYLYSVDHNFANFGRTEKIWYPHYCTCLAYTRHIKKISDFWKKNQYLDRTAQIARFMGPTWGPSGSCRPQMGPMLAPWTLLSGMVGWSISNWWQIDQPDQGTGQDGHLVGTIWSNAEQKIKDKWNWKKRNKSN